MLSLLLTGWLCLGTSRAQAAPPQAIVKTGIDVLESDGFKELKGKRIGLITNKTGQDHAGRGTAEILSGAPDVNLVALFAPEHGFSIASEANSISSSSIEMHGRSIPIYSLHRGGMAGMRLEPKQLKDIDVLVFDMQDVGARFYTYLSAMGMALEDSKKAGIEFMVLDRPNPITGTIIEGPILDDLSLRQTVPTAYFPVPIRHGMTAGEMALLYNAEIKNPKLSVIKISGWSRNLWYDETGLPWTPPSPNIPDLGAATLYPGIGIFEASNISVGRGTPQPFRWIGAPWLNAPELLKALEAANIPGIRFSPQDYIPANKPNSLYIGKTCHGLSLTITNRDQLRPVALFVEISHALMRLHPKELKWDWHGIKAMVGTDKFQKMLQQGASAAEIQKMFDQGAKDFQKIRKPYLLY